MSKLASRSSAFIAFRTAASAWPHLSASVWDGPLDQVRRVSSDTFIGCGGLSSGGLRPVAPRTREEILGVSSNRSG